MARIQVQLNESITADSPVHRRVVVEWSVAPSGLVRQGESSLLRTRLRDIVKSRAGLEALSEPTLFDVAVALLAPLRQMRNDTAHVTVHATGSSASAYIVQD